MQEKYDEIYNSVVNGQRKQAVGQMIELGLGNVPDLIDYISIKYQPETALELVKAYFRIIGE